MVKSAATTVTQYLEEMPPDRRAAAVKVRDVILRNLPKGYEESVIWGMITYALPLSRYPDTYNGEPLCYAGLASHKDHLSIYLTGAYADPVVEKSIKDGFKKAGKKLDMGKSCIRFRAIDDLPLDVIGQAVAAIPPDAFVRQYEKARAQASAGRKKTAARKATTARKKK
jgi:uncharacterized protein DUF1801